MAHVEAHLKSLSIKTVSRSKIDPRITVCCLLLFYLISGIEWLGFNRSYTQVFLTSLCAIGLHYFYQWIFKLKKTPPFSAFITSLSLSILLNFGHHWMYALVPVFLAISSKQLFTYNGRHVFNPALAGLVLSLLMTNEFISPAPAYQWNGSLAYSLAIIMPAAIFFLPQVNRWRLVLSFLFFFMLQLLLRTWMIKHYLPFETLFIGTISTPAFFLFTFFMMTDPATSPSGHKAQILTGFFLALFDLFFHLFYSYHTFFYAAFTIGSAKLLALHIGGAKKTKNWSLLLPKGDYLKKWLVIGLLLGGGVAYYTLTSTAHFTTLKPQFEIKKLSAEHTGLRFRPGDLLNRVDPRVKHMAKWILAISDGLAIADVNNDGLMDIFMTNAHKSQEDRNALFINKGNLRFERSPQGELSHFAKEMEVYGVPSNALFADVDNDGDRDLLVTSAFGSEGRTRLFKNAFKQTGKVQFDLDQKSGINDFTNSATANFLDINKDGLLDLVVGNTIATHLPDYPNPTPLNLFQLPREEFEGDRRMFNFMHESWHKAANAGLNYLYIQRKGGKFERGDNKAWGLTETRWTMAIGTADFNRDGFTDLYMANDFGPDNYYMNRAGKSYVRFQSKQFGEIGKDTYKGMNATVMDFDRNGWMDVYISNVHHPLQAEGSLLWSFSPNGKIEDRAAYVNLLNANRFGWGAAVGDLNRDGWEDLLQANGMVDDQYDRQHEKCPDYWYINEKLARSPPSIHRYIDRWGDIRGHCIHGHEMNRISLNRGNQARPQFIDATETLGMTEKGNWRGVAAVDLDNDGDLDFIFSSLFRDPSVYQNHQKNKHSWIGIELESLSPQCSREGIGSRVELQYRDSQGKFVKQVRERSVANGFSAQGDPRLFFGLGEDAQLIDVTVFWCLKEKRTYKNLVLNQYQKLVLSR